MSGPAQAREERERQAQGLLKALRSRSRSQSYGWGGDMTVEAGLLLEGYRFEFVQAVRLLTRIARRQPAGRAAATTVAAAGPAPAARTPQVGHAPEDALLDEEAHSSLTTPPIGAAGDRISLKLRSRIGFDFPPASVHSVRLSADVVGQIEVIANLMALGGTNAPLPEAFAELVQSRQRVHDTAMTDFLDIFHHRLLDLYYTSTVHTAPWLSYTHPATNELAQMMYSVAGLGPAITRGRTEKDVPDRVWLRYAGLLWHRPRSASALARILTDHFGVRVRLGRAVGRWLRKEPEDNSRLSQSSCVLGTTATLGTRVWLGKAGVLLHVGPLSFAAMHRFLPGAPQHRQLLQMFRFYVQDCSSPDLLLEVDRQTAEPAKLGAARLGWTSWIGPQRSTRPLETRLRASAV